MDPSRQEDVVDLVTIVSYKSTPFMSRIGESVATNTYHEWLTDAYVTNTTVGIEGADVSIRDMVAPSRQHNEVQLFQDVASVSDTELALPHYGMNDPLEYQIQKSLIGIARQIELSHVLGTGSSGSSGVARYESGAIAQISTNKTTMSVVTLTEDIFNQMLAGVYNSGTDEDVDAVFTGTYQKRLIDKFATNVTRYVDADEFKQVLRVDVYTSSFGQHEIILERNVPTSGLLGIDTSKWRTAWLVNRRVATRPLAKTGSSTKVLIEGEATLEALNEASSFYLGGLANS